MDTHGKTILVTGATGNQGGATARHLLADGWHVRALIRDATTPAAAWLAAAGAELVLGDLMDFGTWLERSGRARLLTQLEALPA